LTTSLSVTDVCFEVGYNSLGTFTSRFTQLVGLSPTLFRDLAKKMDPGLIELVSLGSAPQLDDSSSGLGLSGWVISDAPIDGLIFVGLFPTSIPQSRPVAGTLLTSPGRYHIGSVRDGRYFAFAAAFPLGKDLL